MHHRLIASTAIALTALAAAPAPAFAGDASRTYSPGCDSRLKGRVVIKTLIHTYDHGQSVSIEPDTYARLEFRDCRSGKLIPKVPIEMNVSIDDQGWSVSCAPNVGTSWGVSCGGSSSKKTLTFNTITSRTGVATFRLSPYSDFGFIDGRFGDSVTTRINVSARVRGVEVGPTEAHARA